MNSSHPLRERDKQVAIIRLLLNLPTLTERYIAHDIGNQVANILAHISSRAPPVFPIIHKLVAKIPDVLQNLSFHGLDIGSTQRTNIDATAKRMLFQVRCRIRRRGSTKEVRGRCVNIGPPDIGTGAVDVAQCLSRFDRYAPRTKTHDFSFRYASTTDSSYS